MKDAGEFDDDKSIAEFTLENVTEKSISIQINFGDHSQITSSIIEPDVLEVFFLKPEVF